MRPIDKEKMLNLFNDGLTYEQIRRRLKISRSYLERTLKVMGLRRRPEAKEKIINFNERPFKPMIGEWPEGLNFSNFITKDNQPRRLIRDETHVAKKCSLP